MASSAMDAASSIRRGSIYDPVVTRKRSTHGLLLSIPLELRLMIYEHATYVGKPIEPRQVADRSNKFVWGDFVEEFAHKHPSRHLQVKVPQGGPLVIPTLLRVCRQIHEELERYPVFYRGNYFRFQGYRPLHHFLAALTPARRDMIRQVEFSNDRWAGLEVLLRPKPAPEHQVLCRNRPDISSSSDALALLSHCKGLQEFKVIEYKHRDRYYPSGAELELYWLMSTFSICRQVAEFPDLASSYFSLPGFKLTAVLSAQPPLNIDLSDGQPILSFPKWTQPWLRSESVIAQINEVKAIVSAYKQRVASDSQRLKAQCSDARLQAAVRAARLDFPGEARMTQNRNDIPGPISRRTRGQAKGHKNTSTWGTLDNGIQPKYDMEGRLIWDVERINNVRWRGGMAAIECEVVWLYSGDGPKTSWEELHTMVSRFGLYLLDTFYSATWKNRARDLENAANQLQIFQNLPKPNDLVKAIETIHVDDNNYEHTQDYKQLIHRWLSWDVKWKKAIKDYRAILLKGGQVGATGNINVGARRNSRVLKAKKSRSTCEMAAERVKEVISVKLSPPPRRYPDRT